MELGLNQEEVADKLGVDYTTLNQKINNNRRLYLDEVAKLCKILNIKTSKELREYFGLDFLITADSCEIATNETLGGA